MREGHESEMVIEKGKSDGRHDKCLTHAKGLTGEDHLSISLHERAPLQL